MYKILALDLDGTLLNEKHKISDRNKETLTRLKKKGVKIILASGREPTSILPYSRELDLEELVIGFNGGIISDSTGEKIIYEENIDEKIAKDLVRTCEEKDIFNIIFVKNNLYVSDKNDMRFKKFKKYSTSKIEEVGSIYKFIEANDLWNSIGKMLQCGENKPLSILQKEIEDKYSEELSAQFSLPYFLEVYNSKASKGNALDKIAENYNLSRKDVVAIGDGENDLSMIKYAQVGIAMENALDQVKMQSDFITLSNKEDGVSYAIDKYWRD